MKSTEPRSLLQEALEKYARTPTSSPDTVDNQTEFYAPPRGVYRRQSSRLSIQRPGLPIICDNCGTSFYSNVQVDMTSACYCSGDCKWSVYIYQEMERRLQDLCEAQEDDQTMSYPSFEIVDTISCS